MYVYQVGQVTIYPYKKKKKKKEPPSSSSLATLVHHIGCNYYD